MASPVRVGVVGCGKIADVLHVPDYLALRNVRIAALCDVVPAKIEAMKRRHGLNVPGYESLDALRKLHIDTSEFIATGGGAKSDALLQVRADVLGTPFVRLKNTECGIAGAAMLAGLATGVYANAAEAVACFVAREAVFEPNQHNHERYAEIFDRYRRLYQHLRGLLCEMSRERIRTGEASR